MEWVHIEDKEKPENDATVIVALANGEVTAGIYHKKLNRFDGTGYQILEATHWQPLPEHPGIEEERWRRISERIENDHETHYDS